MSVEEASRSVMRKNRELGAVLDVSMVLTSSFDPERNLTEVMDILAGQLEMQRGCVFLLDRETGVARIVAAHGLADAEIRKGIYRMGEGIVGRVIETGSVMFVPDIGDEPQFLNKTGSRVSREGISFISVPMRIGAETYGVISVDRIYAEEHGGVEDDLRVLKIVSSLIAQYLKLWEIYRRSERERDRLKTELEDRYSLPNIVGASERFQAVLKTVLKVAATDATVLLLGESGTGKELIARTLHYQSRRSKKPYVAVNCATLPVSLIEAELFGVEKGAYTGATASRPGRFEMADGGTLFLDEVGELPFEVQAKLLRVLQERTFERVGSTRQMTADVRVIAATNRLLEEEIVKGAFREDLYWRLNVLPIVLPPLRDRADDVPALVEFYARKFSAAYCKEVAFTGEAVEALKNYGWPGNVRELGNTVERLVIMADGDVVGLDAVPWQMRQGAPVGGQTPGTVEACAPVHAGLSGEVETLERQKIEAALRASHYVRVRAARALGITARQLGYRIRKYGIDVQQG
jgi:Nif-specific regulatory protein